MKLKTFLITCFWIIYAIRKAHLNNLCTIIVTLQVNPAVELPEVRCARASIVKSCAFILLEKVITVWSPGMPSPTERSVSLTVVWPDPLIIAVNSITSPEAGVPLTTSKLATRTISQALLLVIVSPAVFCELPKRKNEMELVGILLD